MQIRNVDRPTLDAIAQELHVRTIDAYAPPNAVGVCLRVDHSQPRDLWGDLPYQKTTKFQRAKLRRTAAVCWHGHYAFLFTLFNRHPKAIVRTNLPDYGRVTITAANFKALALHSLSTVPSVSCGCE